MLLLSVEDKMEMVAHETESKDGYGLVLRQAFEIANPYPVHFGNIFGCVLEQKVVTESFATPMVVRSSHFSGKVRVP